MNKKQKTYRIVSYQAAVSRLITESPSRQDIEARFEDLKTWYKGRIFGIEQIDTVSFKVPMLNVTYKIEEA